MQTRSLAVPTLQIDRGIVHFKEGTVGDIQQMSNYWFTSDLPGSEDELTEEIIEVTRQYLISLVEKGDILIIAELEGEMVGRLFINLKDRQKPNSRIKVDHPTGIIERVKVSIEHQGIGRALIANAELVILDSGLSASEMGVHEANTRALAIYESLGYTQLLSDHEERTALFHGFITYRYQGKTAILFKYLR
ncbi:MAG TPA: GNAT family N-acetyltransferase [Oculatellaceae cyanobacterium]